MIFQTERFGAFIHYGIYSQLAWHEQDQLRRSIPKAEYVKLQDTFNPAEFDAEEWARFFKEAGAEYICFTAKHHDGFCMWDSALTDYKITNTPFGRDLLKELADACEKYGLALEIYYSCPDWHQKNSMNFGEEAHQLPCPNEGDEPNDDLYVEYVKGQVRELLTGYGRIQGFFWDIPPKRRDPSVNELVRSLQPGILINDRGYDKGDYSTPEREASIKNASFDRLCEACQSVGAQSWGYREDEDYFTPASLIASMSDIMVRGGNYLLNVGPMANGRLPEVSRDIFFRCANWYQRVRESLVEAEYLPLGSFRFTRKGNALYLHLPAACATCGVHVKPLTVAPLRATVLNTGAEIPALVEYLPWDYNGRDNTPHLHLKNIPANELMAENIVVKLEFADVDAALAAAGGEGKVIL